MPLPRRKTAHRSTKHTSTIGQLLPLAKEKDNSPNFLADIRRTARLNDVARHNSINAFAIQHIQSDVTTHTSFLKGDV
jgi:hypothetical protein